MNKELTHLKAITEVVLKINSSLSISDVMSMIYLNIRKEMSIDFFIISSYFENNDMVKVEFCVKKDKVVNEKFETKSNNPNSLTAYTIKSRKEIIINDLTKDYNLYLSGNPQLHGKEDLWCESVLMFPLIVQSKVIGLFSVQNEFENSFTLENIDFLRMLSPFIGIALNNAYLHSTLGKEKKRSEELLLNILPEEVAEELKTKGEAEAKLIDNVTVLFTDFKGFTAMSEKLSHKELVKNLHECFTAFDYIMEKHGLEKIKTMGDSYMAAGGLLSPNITHAIDAVKAAMEMRDFIAAGKAQKSTSSLPYFEIRIGIHTGPVVAGIVGIKKFSYDIWGDTVNIASRMESSGEAGQINISETTYEIVKDSFVCEYRGKVEAKGKGKVKMYFVDTFTR